MADPLRARLVSLWNVDDPIVASDLPGPRRRFLLREGAARPEGAEEAVRRAMALVQSLGDPLLVRMVGWGAAPTSAEWFPGSPLLVDDRPGAEGSPPRTIHSVTVAADHLGLEAAIRAAQAGAIDLWILGGELLLRLFDGPHADLWGPSEAAMRDLGEMFRAWTVEPPATHDVRCKLAFVCDVRWAAMAPTPRPGVRRCDRCDRDVFEARDELTFVDLARRGECVAAPPGLVSLRTLTTTKIADERTEELMAGIPVREPVYFVDPPEPPKSWWRRLFGR